MGNNNLTFYVIDTTYSAIYELNYKIIKNKSFMFFHINITYFRYVIIIIIAKSNFVYLSTSS